MDIYNTNIEYMIIRIMITHWCGITSSLSYESDRITQFHITKPIYEIKI